jgi:DNA adenine methylase
MLNLKPFVKWAGGKRQLLGEIKRKLPKGIESRRYFEPFVGGGALLFELQPQNAVISDFNKDLIMCYKQIRDHVEGLIEALKNHREQHCKEYYYKIRDLDRTISYMASGETEKAGRLIYLNKTCYNGLYRVNSQGFFNVPLGKYKNPLICEDSLLRAISRYLNSANISILSTDFEEAVSKAGTDSFVYFDPPYHSFQKTGFKSYQAQGFDENEQIRLRDLFLGLTEQGVPCLLSNADTPFIRELYCDNSFELMILKARRAINSDHRGRGMVNELLIKNWR